MTESHCTQVNEELTAEEWKKRYEKKKGECEKLKAALSKAEAELARLVKTYLAPGLFAFRAFRLSVIRYSVSVLSPLSSSARLRV